MTNPTSNFNWQMPTASDLVTDLPADFETFGQAVDTTLADLKGGTTGQILSKASGTDMDFTWVAPTTGDITGVTAGTGITGGGTSGTVTVSFDEANFGGAQGAAGKNIFLNSDFSVWQRGTSFTNPANQSFTTDRWSMYYDGSGATRTISQQTFAGDNPTGCNASYYLRWAQSVAGTGSTTNALYNKIEDVRKFNGQTVTVSFWAKADATRTIVLQTYQEFGSGGSGAVLANSVSVSATTSWQRFSSTFTMPSVSGKTITENSSISHILNFPINATGTFDVTGFQLELGSAATPFQTATGTIQGEIAACQRYYFRAGGDSTYQPMAWGVARTTTDVRFAINLPSKMRVSPNAVEYSTLIAALPGNSGLTVTALALDNFGRQMQGLTATVSGATAGQMYELLANGSTNAYVGLSAEL
jgi:hypothetical protein